MYADVRILDASSCSSFRYAPMMPAMMTKLKPITFCEALLVALDLEGGRDFQPALR